VLTLQSALVDRGTSSANNYKCILWAATPRSEQEASARGCGVAAFFFAAQSVILPLTSAPLVTFAAWGLDTFPAAPPWAEEKALGPAQAEQTERAMKPRRSRKQADLARAGVAERRWPKGGRTSSWGSRWRLRLADRLEPPQERRPGLVHRPAAAHKPAAELRKAGTDSHSNKDSRSNTDMGGTDTEDSTGTDTRDSRRGSRFRCRL
jgi:hypothetical protein